jgi:pimeloyl-ACP methyl ester carboxylesterase
MREEEMPVLSFSDLMTRSVAELNQDEAFVTWAKYFSARLEFRQDDESVSLDIRDGKVVAAVDGSHVRGADLVFSAPGRFWLNLAAGEVDFDSATNPVFGGLVVHGDQVMMFRNHKSLWLLFKAITRAGGGPKTITDFTPGPKSSGRETIGRYANVNGIRTYYDEAGEGQPIIGIHTASGDSMQFRHVVDGLSDEYHVMAIDLPGHGKSLEPEEGQWKSLTKHIEFLEAFVKTLGLERPVMIGCSMGGNMVVELAARQPKGYAAMVSCQGALYTPTLSRLHLDMLLTDNQQLEECLAASLTGNRTPPDRAREILWQINRSTPAAANGDLTGYADYDARDRVAGIECPILLVRGDGDWIVSQEQVEETQKQVPGSRIAIFRGSGHFPMFESPYEFNETVRAFLKEHGI